MKNKRPIALISTDWHLKENNIDQIKDLVTQKCELAKSLNLDIVICLGDIFNSRVGQKETVLTAFSQILDIIGSFGLVMWAIPGNHDKERYESSDSFLEPFKHHPAFKYINLMGGIPAGDNIMLHLLPFYKESKWLQKLQDLKDYISDTDKTTKYVLLSHTAFNGSVNNDGSKVECGISVSDVKEFDLVLLGHYHDQQQIAKNVFHIPSLQQNNFGENTQKGFTVLYDDLSFDLIKSNFKEYEKVLIDFDNISKTDLEALKKTYAKSDKNIRIEFSGASDKVKTINKEEFSVLGIDIKVKVKEIEDTIEYSETEIKSHDKSSIIVEFADFCEQKDKDFDEGVIYLKKKLDKQ